MGVFAVPEKEKAVAKFSGWETRWVSKRVALSSWARVSSTGNMKGVGEKLVEIKFTILAMEKQILFKKVFIMDSFPTYNQVENNKMNPKVFITQLNSYEHFTKKDFSNHWSNKREECKAKDG